MEPHIQVKLYNAELADHLEPVINVDLPISRLLKATDGSTELGTKYQLQDDWYDTITLLTIAAMIKMRDALCLGHYGAFTKLWDVYQHHGGGCFGLRS